PQERVVDATSIEARDVAFVVAQGAAEEVYLVLALAAILPGQETAGRNADVVEADGVSAARRQELVVESDRVEVGDRLVARDRRGLVHTVREGVAGRAAEEVGSRGVEDPDDVIRRGRDVGGGVMFNMGQISRAGG